LFDPWFGTEPFVVAVAAKQSSVVLRHGVEANPGLLWRHKAEAMPWICTLAIAIVISDCWRFCWSAVARQSNLVLRKKHAK
jgi:hypothetical protein